jgi:hypothetical protein
VSSLQTGTGIITEDEFRFVLATVGEFDDERLIERIFAEVICSNEITRLVALF